MTPYEFGDVVLIGFPFTNLQAIKKRPAVILSSRVYQQQRGDVILMAITSQIQQPLGFGDYLLQDWQACGLIKPSQLKPLLATLESTQVIRSMGKLSDRDRQGLQAIIQTILDRPA
jgi:mRNA interferase MazF